MTTTPVNPHLPEASGLQELLAVLAAIIRRTITEPQPTKNESEQTNRDSSDLPPRN